MGKRKVDALAIKSGPTEGGVLAGLPTDGGSQIVYYLVMIITIVYLILRGRIRGGPI